jgi:hypothetical protein
MGSAVVVLAVTTAAIASAQPPTSPTAAMTRLNHSRVLSYPAEQVWPAALRYLRVDRHYVVVDRDREAGFILFDFPLDARPDSPLGRGSVELVATRDAAGRPSVKVSVSTDAGPVHLPHAIADGLAEKLRAEQGPPASPPTPEPPAPPPSPPSDGPWVELPPEDDAPD